MSVDGGADGGEVVSKALVFQGNQLRVNLRAPGGELRAELRDAAGRPMRGFTFSDSLPVSGDGLALPVKWHGNIRSRQDFRDARPPGLPAQEGRPLLLSI